MIAGVCGGLAQYLGWDPTALRVLFVLATIFSFGLGGIIAYVVLGIVMPAED
jgi:phage shock protein C